MLKKSQEQFINELIKIHGKKYDYSKVKYINSKNKVIIICPEHGEFEQLPESGLRGKGCLKCGNKYRNPKPSKTQVKFLKECRNIHGNKYDYSKVKYINSSNKVIIICPEHGEFEQIPPSHLLGKGCIECGKMKNIYSLNNDILFLEKSLKLHGNKYDYSKVKYINSLINVIIICPEHGEFKQLPNAHLKGSGCPKCVNKISKSEQEIYDFILSLGIYNILQSNRTILNNKELDIYLPDYNLGIEFNGLYWHNEDYKEDNYHQKKTDECLSKNIQLIQIFEDEWLHKKDIVKSRLLNILNKIQSNRIINSDECYIKEIDNIQSSSFCKRNHLQGFVGAKIHLGLFYIIDNKEYFVSYIGFNNIKNNDFQLIQFCNVINYEIINGLNKLIEYFENTYKPEKIIIHVDRRWSNGDSYKKLEFTQLSITKPNYFYIKSQKRYINTNELNLSKIYDSGNLILEKIFQT